MKFFKFLGFGNKKENVRSIEGVEAERAKRWAAARLNAKVRNMKIAAQILKKKQEKLRTLNIGGKNV